MDDNELKIKVGYDLDYFDKQGRVLIKSFKKVMGQMSKDPSLSDGQQQILSTRNERVLDYFRNNRNKRNIPKGLVYSSQWKRVFEPTKLNGDAIGLSKLIDSNLGIGIKDPSKVTKSNSVLLEQAKEADAISKEVEKQTLANLQKEKKTKAEEKKANAEKEKAAREEVKKQEQARKEFAKKKPTFTENVKAAFGANTLDTKKFSSLFKAGKNFLHLFKRVIDYKIVRGLISLVLNSFSTGINNLYQYSSILKTDFKPVMDSLATSVQYLRNAIGSFTGTFITTLAPAITTALDGFAELTNKANEFIATITGQKSYQKAVKAAKTYASEIRQIFGFDELNTLSNTEDYQSMFQQIEVLTSAGSIAEGIKSSISEGDWSGVGALFAEKLNSALSVDADFDMPITKTIGNIFETVVSTTENLEWYKVGETIANGLSTMFSNLKVDKLLPSIGVFVQSIADVLAGAIDSVDWVNFGSKLVKSILSIDFNGIVKSYFQLLWGEIKGIFSFVGGIISEIWNWMINDVFTISTEDLWNKIKSFISSVGETIKSLWNTMVNNIFSNSWVKNLGQSLFSISTFAKGGYPNTGSLFIAGEAGPEYVGSMNGRTAVYNDSQLSGALESANQGVIRAISDMTTAVVSAVVNKNTSITVNDVRSAINTQSMRYGV